MGREFILPDLGEGLTEAEIVGWLVAPGDEVAIDQPVVELESAKSVVQLPTPFAGVVESLGGEVGEVIHAGSVLMRLAAVGAQRRHHAGGRRFDPPARAVPRSPIRRARVGRVGGRAHRVRHAVHAPRSATRRRPHASGAGPLPGAVRVAARRCRAAARALDSGRRSPVVSPIVRRIAREHGFDASQLDGSGPDHLVMRRDVESFIARVGHRRGAGRDIRRAGARDRARRRSHTAPSTDEGDRRVPLDRTARAAAAHFARSRREIPEATVWMDVDATALLAARRHLQEATGERYGVTALVARFVVAGLQASLAQLELRP